MDVESLDELMSKQALHELLMRYCRAVDRCDGDLLASVFHADAHDDHGLYRGGPDGFVEWLLERQGHFVTSMHCILNELFVVDGDHATGESYYVSYASTSEPIAPLEAAAAGADGAGGAAEVARSDHGLNLIIAGGRYLDRFERRDGVWRISQRRVVHEWGRVIVETEPMSDLFVAAARDRSDPSYELLGQ